MKTRIAQLFSIPARESHLAVALGFSVVMMAALLWCVMWQADVIDYQRDVIRTLWVGRFGG
jgi:hypothetical protein